MGEKVCVWWEAPTASGGREGWARCVTGVDTSETGAKSFVGHYIKGRCEIELEIGSLVLQVAPMGSVRRGWKEATLYRVNEKGGMDILRDGETWDWWRNKVSLRNAVLEELYSCKKKEVDGLCLKCGKTVDDDQVCSDCFPSTHKECGGEVAFNIDIKGALKQCDPVFHDGIGPSPGEFSEMIGVRTRGDDGIVTVRVRFPDETREVVCQVCGDVVTMRSFRNEKDVVIKWQGVCLCQSKDGIINVYQVPTRPTEFITLSFVVEGERRKGGDSEDRSI